MIVGCSDGTDAETPESSGFRLGKFELKNTADSRLAQVTLQLPLSASSASSRGIAEAYDNTNYYECWGFFHDATRLQPNYYYWEPVSPVGTDLESALPGGFSHDGLVQIYVPAGKWDFIVLAGNKRNPASKAYYYNYAQSFAQNKTNGTMGRPLLLASGKHVNFNVFWGIANIVPITLNSVDFTFTTLSLVPASKAGSPQPFVVSYTADIKNDLLALSSFGVLNVPKGTAVDIQPTDKPARFTAYTVLDKKNHEAEQKQESPYTATEKWGFIAPIVTDASGKAHGEISVLNWYVHAFVIPPNDDAKAILGKDADGNLMFRNQWAIADAKNTAVKTNWPLTTDQTQGNTLGAVFRQNITFDTDVTPPTTWIDVEWGY